MPELSIITINLNNAHGLRKTIESVVGQNFTDYEYIIIDGGSTDGSVEVINEFEDKIAYWVSEPDEGIYYAMNKGIRKAKGEYIQFLNSGDIFFSPSSLSIAFNCIERTTLKNGFVFFDFIYSTNNKETLISSNEVRNKFFIYKKGFGHPSTFYKRDLFKTYGLFDEKFQIAADRDFYLKALVRKKEAFLYFCFPVSVFFEGGISTNKKHEEQLKLENNKLLNEHFTQFERKLIESKHFKKVLNLRIVGKLILLILQWNLNRKN